jgi:hypothetical protein
LKTSRTSAICVTVALGAMVAALPALSQDTPESLLPPGFNDPVEPAPSPTPAPAATPQGGETLARPAGPPDDLTGNAALGNDSLGEAVAEELTPEELERYELPAFARRSLNRVGFAAAGRGGLPANAFGGDNGRFLEVLMRRLDAPIASRWLSIALRRALVSEVDTPAGVNGADFAAERAWLLIRMGEANAARGVVQSVDVADYTPKMFQIAQQAALATGDPAGMCPLVDGAMRVSAERGWRVAEAMCAALAGRPEEAGRLIDAARRQGAARGIDLVLAEKIVGAGAQGRRAVTVEWDNVDRLDAWRWGLAAATGELVPARLIDTVGPQVRLWQALAPALPAADRLASAELAAVRGVYSGAAYRDLFALVSEAQDVAGADATVIEGLTDAYAAQSIEGRLTALRNLWQGSTPIQRHARLVLTSDAAARIPAAEAYVGDADALIASMLTAGKDLRALRWRGLVPARSDGWAMLALADPAGRIAVDGGDLSAYGGAESRKAQLLFAGLAGLGRLPENQVADIAQALAVPINTDNSWTDAIRTAASRGEPGTVLLLAAVGMQTSDWRGVSPVALFNIVAALDAVGLNGEARMIAAEAIARA